MAKVTKLKEDNYFSQENMTRYLSCSQYKAFVGTPFLVGCEARAMAELKGEYVKPKSDALLIGSYVDAALTGSEKELQKFLEEHPEMISSRGETKGQLKAVYKQADVMIERARRDKFFMKTLEGEQQKIFIGELFGVPTKIKVDVLGDKFITDLKTCESITKSYYDPIQNKRVSFIEYMDYVLQGAIYQEIVRQNTGKTLPFFISAVSKESTPDIAVIQIDNDTLKEKLASIEDNVKSIQLIKEGKVEACGCGRCEYCREKKVLNKPINWLELSGELD